MTGFKKLKVSLKIKQISSFIVYLVHLIRCAVFSACFKYSFKVFEKLSNKANT